MNIVSSKLNVRECKSFWYVSPDLSDYKHHLALGSELLTNIFYVICRLFNSYN